MWLRIPILVLLALLALLWVKDSDAQPMVERGKPYYAVIHEAVADEWPGMKMPSYIPSQIEKESRWNPTAQLCVPKPTCSKELGVGFGQFTVTPKFNAWLEVKAMSVRLADWKWEDRYNPQLQIYAMVAKNHGNYRQCIKLMQDEKNAMHCTMASYNGGYGGFLSDRRVCSNTAGCDPRVWYGNVENTSLKSKVRVEGYGEPFFHINRRYVRETDNGRAKYAPFFEGK